MGGFTTGHDGDRADERHKEENARRFDRHEMPAKQVATKPGNVILGQRIEGRRGRDGRGGRGITGSSLRRGAAAGGWSGRQPTDGQRQHAEHPATAGGGAAA